MRNDFAVFILTHGRAEHVVTMDTLRRQGYSGRWYMILDNEDEQANEYEKRYGSDYIIIFDKAAAYERTDTMDNFHEHRAIVYARNEAFRIAKDLGLTYFLMLDDDFTGVLIRFPDNKKLASKTPKWESLEDLFEAMLEFLDSSGASTVALAQGGDLIGGIESGMYWKGITRKAMNSFFCRTDRPIAFCGTMNEDVTAYTTLGGRGELFFTFTHAHIIQVSTQATAGGMTEVYQESGTYVKSFYSVMASPSCVKVGMFYSKNKRIHHKIDWESAVPKIIREEHRRG